MSHDTPSPFNLFALDDAGNPCDYQGLPLPLSEAVRIRNRIDLAVAHATPRYLADLRNRRLLDRGESYLEQFEVTDKDMA
jgi:hypothetical protein